MGVKLVVAGTAGKDVDSIPAVKYIVRIGADAGDRYACHIGRLNGAVVEGEAVLAAVVAVEIVIQGNLVIAAVGPDQQVVAVAGEYRIGKSGAAEAQGVEALAEGLVVHRVPAVSFGKDIGIGFTITAVEQVVTGAADQGVVAVAAM